MINIREYISRFDIYGNFLRADCVNSGHINETYFVQTDSGNEYILQRINNYVFKNVDELMHNIDLVTSFIYDEVLISGGDPERETMKIVPCRDGKLYYEADDHTFWRMYVFIKKACTFQRVENPRIFNQAGKAFGVFQKRLSKFDANLLAVTIPDFHNTPKRYVDFLSSVKNDKSGRAKFVKDEIDFVVSRANKFDVIEKALASGEIPTRVTHNDTKLNNVMFDNQTGDAVCVIDLDTVMPSTLLYDFGDAVRFGCNTGTEETEDLDMVNFNLDLYEVFASGFFDGIEAMTNREVELLPFSAWIMTIECGMRFLSDYIDGDKYFRVKTPDDNKIRCRTQFKLVKCMENYESKMTEIINNLAKAKKVVK